MTIKIAELNVKSGTFNSHLGNIKDDFESFKNAEEFLDFLDLEASAKTAPTERISK